MRLNFSHEHRTVGAFDIDALYDYRARRPRLVFDTDHYASLDYPELLVSEVRDAQGTGFLLLHGPEPDFAWRTFCAAVVSKSFGVGTFSVENLSKIVYGYCAELVGRKSKVGENVLTPSVSRNAVANV